jgi:hypothetical protein
MKWERKILPVSAFPVLPLISRTKDSAMGEIQDFKNFRIWAALGIAVVYMLLAASGNA